MNAESPVLLAALQAVADGSYFYLSGYTFRTPAEYAVAELARLGYRRVWRADGTQWVWEKGEPIAVTSAV